MPFFTRPFESEPIEGEREDCEAQRIEVERLLKLNSEELARNPAPPSIGVHSSGGMKIQTLKASPRRELLLREQWKLVQRRNSIYEKWAVLTKAKA